MNGRVRKGRKMRKRLIIGMSGVSGAPLTIELLKQLQQYKEIIETHLIVTKGAEMTLEQIYALADEVHD
jgi:3-polyprenyl-4-hydroxybenzoate decarboxylase